ncbi:MAG: M67 family metallopeptidase [Alphaproteobacteria bacterium]|nr:M67 family metallopeptidase [Alphaproteobacteria bacterium]
MITLSITHEDMGLVLAAAEAAYPAECCGLLVGEFDPIAGLAHVTRVVPSRNLLAGEASDRFEIDPAVRFRVMREPGFLIGHYHSHPDGPAQPSARDRAMVYEPELVWLIIAVAKGRALQASAFRGEGLEAILLEYGQNGGVGDGITGQIGRHGEGWLIEP